MQSIGWLVLLTLEVIDMQAFVGLLLELIFRTVGTNMQQVPSIQQAQPLYPPQKQLFMNKRMFELELYNSASLQLAVEGSQ